MRFTRTLLAPIALIGVLAAAGCGSADSNSPTASPGSSGMEKVNVAVLAAADAIPVYLAADQGMFKKQGLEVTTTVVSSGAAMVPAVLNGQQQFGFANTLSILTAASKGLPVRIVSNGVTANPDATTSGNALLVSPTSGIATPKDLEGRTIAITSIGDMGQTTSKEWMTRAGADPAKVHWVELAFPDMVPAIQRGDVDGAVLVEPFQTNGMSAGLVKAADPGGAVIGGDPLAVYFSSQSYVKSHADVVARFQRAMKAALDYAQQNPDQARAEIAKVLKTPGDVANKMALPLWNSTLTTKQLDAVAKVAENQGLTSKKVDVAAVLVQSPSK